MNSISANYEVLVLGTNNNLYPFDSNNFRTGYTYHQIRCLSNGSATIYPMKGSSFTWNATAGLTLNVLMSAVTIGSGSFIAHRARNERNPFYEDTINMTAATPAPPVINYVFYATALMGVFSNLNAGSYGSVVLDNPANVATWLQANVTSDSGAMTDIIWIVASAEPSDWTIDGNPVSFTNQGVATLSCKTTGDFFFGFGLPDSSSWLLYTLSSLIGGLDTTPYTYYTDGSFSAVFDQFVKTVFGANATSSVSVAATTVNLTVGNSYLTFNQVTSLSDNSDFQNDSTSDCP